MSEVSYNMGPRRLTDDEKKLIKENRKRFREFERSVHGRLNSIWTHIEILIEKRGLIGAQRAIERLAKREKKS